jgi:hypothetical protein
MARQIMAIPFSFKGSCLSDFIMLPSWNKRLRWTMHCWIWQCSSCESGFENCKNHAGNVHPVMWYSLKVSMWTFQPHPGLDMWCPMCREWSDQKTLTSHSRGRHFRARPWSVFEPLVMMFRLSRKKEKFRKGGTEYLRPRTGFSQQLSKTSRETLPPINL